MKEDTECDVRYDSEEQEEEAYRAVLVNPRNGHWDFHRHFDWVWDAVADGDGNGIVHLYIREFLHVDAVLHHQRINPKTTD